jgi:hypothetical protein
MMPFIANINGELPLSWEGFTALRECAVLSARWKWSTVQYAATTIVAAEATELMSIGFQLSYAYDPRDMVTIGAWVIVTLILRSWPGWARVLPPPWDYEGFSQFPALWFGANSSGLDERVQLDLIAKHALSGYGWQQATEFSNYRHYENNLAQAASRLKTFLADQNNTYTKVFVYRHMQMSDLDQL